MMTGRGWWLLLLVASLVVLGLGARSLAAVLVGLTLLVWFCGEAVLFAVAASRVGRLLRLDRQVLDERGPVNTLWTGRTFTVRLELRLTGRVAVPHAALRELVPLAAEFLDGDLVAETTWGDRQPVELRYRLRCPAAGLVRFEGVRVQLADLQGFFVHTLFVADGRELPVLPALVPRNGTAAARKRHNLLPPPGVHRLRQPGSGSELLDLRDYVPGDPPRNIAWKVSARRDRLITKEFESEVPVRCTLFVDTSSSVCVTSPHGKALTRLLELAAGVLQGNTAARDLTGLCLFDEHGSRFVPPGRTEAHVNRLLHLLAEAGTRAPQAARVDPERLLPLAHALAQEVYPHLLRPAVNGMPFWLNWVASFPGYSRRRATLAQLLHRRKPWVLVLCPPVLSPLLYLLLLWLSARQRRLARWRKQLAALLAVRYGLAPGGLEAQLEDDDLAALLLQRFLAEHHVPYLLPLYDRTGRYLFSAPEKVPVLAEALLRSVRRGRDNELFVLLADLLELDEHLDPLLRAVSVALGRHHQVLVVCPWPPHLALPEGPPGGADASSPLAGEGKGGGRGEAASETLVASLRRATRERFHDAFRRVQRRFARLGVRVVAARGEEPVALILRRLEQLRPPGRAR